MVEVYEKDVVEEDIMVSRKRPYQNENQIHNENQSSDSKRYDSGKRPLLKLLVPNFAAGAIIGKGGANISELQSKYGATIRVSHSKEFYPGSDERIVVLIGDESQIIDFHEYISDKISQHISNSPMKSPRDDIRRQQVKIVLPNLSAGIIIGRGGSSIKSLQEETKAKIVLTARDESTVVGERILIITGKTEQRFEAARQVINKIASDPSNMANSNLRYSHISLRGNPRGVAVLMDTALHHKHNFNNVLSQCIISSPQNNENFVPSLSGHPLSALSHNPCNPLLTPGLGNSLDISSLTNVMSVPQYMADIDRISNPQNIQTSVNIEMEIPAALVGLIVGIGGNSLHEIIKFSGAKILLTQKNDFTSGTKILSILGDINQTQIAYYLVNQKLNKIQNELTTSIF